MTTFDPAIIAAVLHHMNDDHPEDSLLIARAFGHTDAADSVMTGLSSDGGTWRYNLAGSEIDLTLMWTAPISQRAEIRREIVVLYDSACAKLGIVARPH
ncbi:MAG: DUF2470 domain-containing protein [Microbacteriaceae bacterium]